MATGYPITDPSDSFASGLQSRTNANGPVTRAMAAMRSEPEPNLLRRGFLKAATAGAALGATFGITLVQAAPADLAVAADEYLDGADALGLWFTIDSRTGFWCGAPVSGTAEQKQAREAYRQKLNSDPRLRREVIAAVARSADGPPESFS